MAISKYPSGNRNYFDFIRYFRPNGSQTVVSVKDVTTDQMFYMLKWGDEIYLPVKPGQRIGVCVYNGRRENVAYPTYIEAANLWEGGPEQPEMCSPSFMWEIGPRQRHVFDAMMNPNAQKGRPLIVDETGFGGSVGEAMFGTDEYRGQIRVYERLQLGGGYQPRRQTNVGNAEGDPDFGAGIRSKGNFGQESLSIFPDSDRGEKGIGGKASIHLGDDEHRSHHFTGISYQTNAQPVVFLRVEFQRDLKDKLSQAWGTMAWDWTWQMPSGSANWWDEPWQWRPGAGSGPTAPNIPVNRPRPHRPS